MRAYIYNLFPRLAGTFDNWKPHFQRAADMGFEWLYLNPVFYPGFSGSIYSVKDFRYLDPVICPDGQELLPVQELRPILDQAKSFGLRPMIDLVINHTAKDSALVSEHPEWFCRDETGEVQSPFAIDPADARRKTVWGDLAELDHLNSSDPDGLRAFLGDVIDTCLDIGFEGFRCDAAYKIPKSTWSLLTERARRRFPGTLFVAETLGCRPEEMLALEGAGFDFVMNSSKYWAFDSTWCLEQHEEWQRIAPSVAFPESHDTPRLAAETGGQEHVQRQRFLLSATISRGVFVPAGFEFGFKRPLNVVETRAHHWEEPYFDLTQFISRVFALKSERPVLSAEGHLSLRTALDRSTLALEKKAEDDRVLLLINKDWNQWQEIELDEILKQGKCEKNATLVRPHIDRFEETPVPAGRLGLEPAEIALCFC